MTRDSNRLPSSRILKAYRSLEAIESEQGVQNAVCRILSSLQAGASLQHSTAVDLARIVLDCNTYLDRDIRLACARTLARIDSGEIVALATLAIRDRDRPLDGAKAAASILLGSRRVRLSQRTPICLVRAIRRFGQIRGPLVELLQASKKFPQDSRSATR